MRPAKLFAAFCISVLVMGTTAYDRLDEKEIAEAIRRAKLEENLIRAFQWSPELTVGDEVERQSPTLDIGQRFNDPGFRINLHLQQIAHLIAEGKSWEEMNTFLRGSHTEINTQDMSRITGSIHFPHETNASDYSMVIAFDIRGFPFAAALATEDWIYLLDGLQPGRYYVCVFSSNGIQYYDQATDLQTATVVEVGEGVEISSINFTFNSYGAISGNVMGDYGTPLYRTFVTANDPRTGMMKRYSYSREDGAYIILGLEAGEYLVRAGPRNEYAAKYYNNVYGHTMATPVKVSEVDTTYGIHFILEQGATIVGSITDTSGKTIRDIQVYAIDPITGEPFGEFLYGFLYGKIKYEIHGLPSGTYILRTLSRVYEDVYYTNTTDFSRATPIVVRAPYTTCDIDFAVARTAGAIAGNVMDRFGNPAHGVTVEALDPATGKRIQSDETDANGNYLIDGLTTGKYAVMTHSYEYVSEYYDDVHSLSEATPVVINAPFVSDGIDFILGDFYGSITGQIQDEFGNPIKSAGLRAMDPSTGETLKHVDSGENGSYKMHLPDGRYVIWADADWQGYVHTYYDNVSNFDQATLVEVIRPHVTEHIDFVLERGGAVAGRVEDESGEPIKYVRFLALDWETGASRSHALIQYHSPNKYNITYMLRGLSSGQYIIFAQGSQYGYMNMYYDNAAYFSVATPVTVSSSDTTFGVDFVLPKGGVISGQVFEQGGDPISSTYVTAFDASDKEIVSSDKTKSDGRYFLGGLRTGEYVLRADNHYEGWAIEYYDGASIFSEATAVNATVSDTTADINFTLEKGGTLSGFVLDQDSLTIQYPIVMAIDSLQPDNIISGSTYKKELPEGSYVISGLVSGSYFVQTDMASYGYIDEYYDNATDISKATAIHVTAPDSIPGMDFVLDSFMGCIRGRITDTEGTAIFQPSISILDVHTCLPISVKGISNSEGDYLVSKVPEGSYFVKVEISTPVSKYREWSYIPEYFDNAFSFEEATPVDVFARETTEGIDFSLDPILASITGKITDEIGQPLASQRVITKNYFSLRSTDAIGQTGSDGTYMISGLPTGTYIVLVPRGRYTGLYYDQAHDVLHATPVEVVAPYKIPGIDFVLGPVGSIEGQLTLGGLPFSKDTLNTTIIAYDAESGFFRGIDFESEHGMFTIDGLPPGDYKIAALPTLCWSGNACSCAITYFGGGKTFDDSMSLSVKVEPGDSVTGVDIELQKASGFISGRFFNGSQDELLIHLDETFYVYTYDCTGHLVALNAYIDYPFPAHSLSAGTYSIGPLHSGEYFLRCFAEGQHYDDIWYENGLPMLPIRDKQLEIYTQDIPKCATPVIVKDSEETTNIDFYLSQHITNIEEERRFSLPTTFALGQNYPNPFNPTTTIRFALTGGDGRPETRDRMMPIHTTLKIYNILGQEVRTLVDETQDAGYYTVTWDGRDENGLDVCSGIYFYQMKAGDFIETKRMVLLK